MRRIRLRSFAPSALLAPLAPLALALLVAALPCAARTDVAFLRIDGVDGDSTDPAHPGWIEIQAVDYSASCTFAFVGAGTPSCNPGAIGPISVLKRIDRTSPILRALATQQSPISDVRIEICPSADTAACYLALRLENVRVSATAFSERSCVDPATCPAATSESVSFRAVEIEWTWRLPGGNTAEACWNFELRQSCGFGPPPSQRAAPPSSR